MAGMLLPGQRAAAPVIVHRCKQCSDSGVVPITGERPARNGSASEMWRANVPCVCSTGDQFRELWLLETGQLRCKCGAVATSTAFEHTCDACYRLRFNARRKA